MRSAYCSEIMVRWQMSGARMLSALALRRGRMPSGSSRLLASSSGISSDGNETSSRFAAGTSSRKLSSFAAGNDGNRPRNLRGASTASSFPSWQDRRQHEVLWSSAPGSSTSSTSKIDTSATNPMSSLIANINETPTSSSDRSSALFSSHGLFHGARYVPSGSIVPSILTDNTNAAFSVPTSSGRRFSTAAAESSKRKAIMTVSPAARSRVLELMASDPSCLGIKVFPVSQPCFVRFFLYAYVPRH